MFWFLPNEVVGPDYDAWDGGKVSPTVDFLQGQVDKFQTAQAAGNIPTAFGHNAANGAMTAPPLFKLQWLRPWKFHSHFLEHRTETSLYQLESGYWTNEPGLNSRLPSFVNTNSQKIKFNVLFVDFYGESFAYAQAMSLNNVALAAGSH